ncbi:GH36-type glycosyl hydrolase domain-containing protein [Gorillibacterium timonense]|uniref:GH36-type glycosyl hydrolase domain-containing protein n=1 Tax=Gorillibacterium timonense TaxID=1689269 RepID=UPI00071D37B2|nr:cellobiose phosphorylase [Gorillibacterium timonense]
MTNHSRTNGWRFIGEEGDFELEAPGKSRYLYFPLVNEAGMMAAVTPTGSGDVKAGLNEFLTPPMSVEDLHESAWGRNFWLNLEGHEPWSAVGRSAAQLAAINTAKEDETVLQAGFLWHKTIRKHRGSGLRAEVTQFVPASADKVELMRIELVNEGTDPVRFVPTAAIPLYGRSADNLRDHRHVTSLLNRAYTNDHGVEVQPSLSFDERGHRINRTAYAVLGAEGDGTAPIGFYPEVEPFVGEAGSLDWPEAIVCGGVPLAQAGEEFEGYEALGGVRFRDAELQPGARRSYLLILAIAEDRVDAGKLVKSYASPAQFEEHLESTKSYWKDKVAGVEFRSGDPDFDRWMKWVTLQPVLRRLFGNSFLPHHDYGRGGRGWRDLWQDCLALLVMEPDEVRQLLLNNFAGVRIDGSNATIIGSKPGDFVADRNNIPRVWMDHGAWPLLTTLLYLNQSGDLDFLLAEQTYFQDRFRRRCAETVPGWTSEDGSRLRTEAGEVYSGTVLEHLLLQNLVPFFHAGAHGNILLEGADWNDGMDMAADKGESVTFTAFYASNLKELGQLVSALRDRKGESTVEVAEEILLLMDTIGCGVDYDSVEARRAQLERFYDAAPGKVTGRKTAVEADQLIADLNAKAAWLTEHLREQEWLRSQDGEEWFNGYYNNDGERVEGDHPNGVRITLTGQVFPIMGGVATEEQIGKMVHAVDRYLLDPEIGYRLNSRFGGIQQNLGRAFGFAFGHKENGAMFSHMTVMYGNALYQRGFVKEGRKVLESVYALSSDFEKSRIYPGIPEYINERGRGMYHFLTGSASWLLLTHLTEVYGVKGEMGDLVLEPKLTAEQFTADGDAAVTTLFAARRLQVSYRNPAKLEAGSYRVHAIRLNGELVPYCACRDGALLDRRLIATLADETTHQLEVELGAR